jgi:hypothetical protein
MERELTLRIVVENPPAGVDLALQKGRGKDYECVQTQRSRAEDVAFEFRVNVKAGPSATPVFTGPFAQGTPEDRFVYIDIGAYAGESDSRWARRLKIPLTGITSETVDRVVENPHALLEARVPGTGKDGGPSCGTARQFTGWAVALR